MPNPGSRIYGIDVSHNNYLVDESAALSAPGFVWMKAGEGLHSVDTAFPRWAPRMKGRRAGAYWYCLPGEGDPEGAARKFHDTAESAVLDGWALDVETGPQDSSTDQWVEECCMNLHHLTGKPVVIYCARSYASILRATLALPFTLLWLATLDLNYPDTFEGRPVLINQYSWAGSPSGGGSKVDLDVLHGTADDWDTLVAGKTLEPITPPAAEPGTAVKAERPTFTAADFAAPMLAAAAGKESGELGKAYLLHEALRRVGIDAPHSNHFTRASVAAYARWQRQLGFAGNDANGIPGPRTLGELQSRTRLWRAAK
jgi:GH25 family lysozyme M1 (1,4-beta-N-acetylmuramidase)